MEPRLMSFSWRCIASCCIARLFAKDLTTGVPRTVPMAIGDSPPLNPQLGYAFKIVVAAGSYRRLQETLAAVKLSIRCRTLIIATAGQRIAPGTGQN